VKIVIVLAVILAVAALARSAFAPGRGLPRNRVRHARVRLRLRLHPGRGMATTFELWLRWGRFAAWRKSGRIRPSLSAGQRMARPREHSIMLGRAHYRHRLHVPLEEHLLLMAPPRTYKTALLAHIVLRYPGAVISTSTKPDIFALTSGIRQTLGPVQVFNPQRIGAVPSTFRWSPVAGCQDQAVAIRRADSFAMAVSQKGVEDGTFWSAKASDYLRAYFHAAAITGADMRLVARWVLGADPEDPERILAAAGAHQWAATLAELRGEAQKTASTVRMVMSRAVGFMADNTLAASVIPAGQAFDIAAFLRGQGTLYMIAEPQHEDAPVAPLFAAMADEIHYQAELLGQASPAGRPRPSAADGPGRGGANLPRPAAGVAVGFRRQGHPGHHRRPRRGAACQPVAGPWQAGRPGHLRGEGVPARDHRHPHAGDGQQAVRPGRLPRAWAGPLEPPRRGDSGHDPPASRRVRAGHPRRAGGGHRQAPQGLDGPGEQAGPAPWAGSCRPQSRTSGRLAV
jgi:Type IV secretory system Conjugative DNA transfer